MKKVAFMVSYHRNSCIFYRNKLKCIALLHTCFWLVDAESTRIGN
jgi:hypothetical protein